MFPSSTTMQATTGCMAFCAQALCGQKLAARTADGMNEARTSAASAARPCVVVVDPVSTGGVLAAELANRDYAVICVWSNEISLELRTHVPRLAQGLKYHAVVEEQETIEATAVEVMSAAGTNFALLACIVGCETGVLVADALSEALGLRTNGTERNRRDKSVQQKCVKATGMRAVREAAGTHWSEVEAFANLETFPVVVKPVESAGSEGVKLCKSKADAEAHFDLLMSAQRKVGSFGAAVLVQEYLQGLEYVIDHVSRDGVHKTTMVWVYDKRACNGADFVYYGLLPVPAESELAATLIAYTRGVLDALGIKQGATHGEVMMTKDGPCLVEMNCRPHGGDGNWAPLARALTGGYSQVDACIDAFCDEARFEALPDVPPPFQASGQEVILVCRRAGEVVSTPGLDKIRQLKSFNSMVTDVTVGSVIECSVDLFTALGSVFLMHDDLEVMAADLKTIRAMEVDCSLFELAEDKSQDAVSNCTTEEPYEADKATRSFSDRDLHVDLEIASVASKSMTSLVVPDNAAQIAEIGRAVLSAALEA